MHAQYKSGCLIYTLGKDTTAFGNFSLDGDHFSMTVADITDATNISTLYGTFLPNGELKEAEGINYNPGKDSLLIYSYKLKYERDSTFIQIKHNGKVINRSYPVKIMVANALGGYTLLYTPPSPPICSKTSGIPMRLSQTSSIRFKQPSARQA
jgi:hypothetical protein